MRDMKPMTLADIAVAPFRIEQSVTLPGSRTAVFAHLADPRRWLEWFPLMRRADWTSPRTDAVGAEREVSLRVFGSYREQILAWEPGARFSFTMLASTSPLAARMAEDWRLTSDGRETRLDWTVGAHPSLLGRPAAPLLRIVLRRLFVGGGANLRRLLGERGTQVS